MVNAKTKTNERPELSVKRRTSEGTRATRRMRTTGWIPAVVYGKSIQPFSVAVDHKQFIQLIHTKGGEHALINLKVVDESNGSTPQPEQASSRPAKQAKAKDAPTGRWEKPVLVKMMHYHPVDGHILHVDFHAITLTEKIRVKIDVVLRGEPFGVKEQGGVLEHFLREVEMECLPTEIPDDFTYDISAIKIGDTIHVSDLTVPSTAKMITEAEGAIASVQEPRKDEPEEPTETPSEPEVIREKKEEGEEQAKGPGGKGESGEGKARDSKDKA